MFETAIPVIHVSDSVIAEDFYCKRLGFVVSASWRPDAKAKDPCYMTIVRDGARLHLTSFTDGVIGAWSSTVYVFVADVDALYAEFVAKGVSMPGPPINQSWGTREIVVRDPDRNVMNFGQRMASEASS